MEITAEDRKMMNDIVDFHIKNIPEYVLFSKHENIRKCMGITNSYDFVIGMHYAMVLDGITSYLTEKMKWFGTPTSQQFEEIMMVVSEVILERLGDIKRSINQTM